MSKTIKNLAIATVALAIAVLAYVYWPEKKEEVIGSLSSSTGSPVDANQDNVTFIASLSGLKTLTVDPEIFNMPTFQSLKDNTVEILLNTGDVGRVNPFAPVAGSIPLGDQTQNNAGLIPLFQDMN